MQWVHLKPRDLFIVVARIMDHRRTKDVEGEHNHDDHLSSHTDLGLSRSTLIRLLALELRVDCMKSNTFPVSKTVLFPASMGPPLIVLGWFRYLWFQIISRIRLTTFGLGAIT